MRLGTIAPAAFYVGNTPASRIMLGAQEVWSAMDADAAAYIAALTSAGATVSPTQSAAIDAFIVAEKAGSRWDLIKRLYLPIWALEAPNAICMRSLTSGSFVGGVTHGAGFVQKNGTTGYFDMLTSPSDIGVSTALAMLGALHNSNATSVYPVALGLGIEPYRFNFSAFVGVPYIRTRAQWGANLAGRKIDRVDDTLEGICVTNVLSGRLRYYKRRAIGPDTADIAHTETADMPDISVYAMCRNNNGAPSEYSNAQAGSWFVGAGMELAQISAFTLAIQTLWETCTGLTLP